MILTLRRFSYTYTLPRQKKISSEDKIVSWSFSRVNTTYKPLMSVVLIP